MANVVIPYHEMCRREGASLHRGMNHGLGGDHSVILLSARSRPVCDDSPEDGRTTLIYEGHDAPRRTAVPDPKARDQPECFPDGRLTQNGLFHRAAQEFKAGLRLPERVRIYEKIETGVWVYSGVFYLIDSWHEAVGRREVFRFKLLAVEGEEDFSFPPSDFPKPRRVIPAWVKLQVWRRDGGKCAECGARVELRFHLAAPDSRPDGPIGPEHVQLFCPCHGAMTNDRGLITLRDCP